MIKRIIVATLASLVIATPALACVPDNDERDRGPAPVPTVVITPTPSETPVTRPSKKPKPSESPSSSPTASPSPEIVVPPPAPKCKKPYPSPMTDPKVVSTCFTLIHRVQHNVKPGDNWYTIAMRYGLTYQALRLLNGGALFRIHVEPRPQRYWTATVLETATLDQLRQRYNNPQQY